MRHECVISFDEADDFIEVRTVLPEWIEIIDQLADKDSSIRCVKTEVSDRDGVSKTYHIPKNLFCIRIGVQRFEDGGGCPCLPFFCTAGKDDLRAGGTSVNYGEMIPSF